MSAEIIQFPQTKKQRIMDSDQAKRVADKIASDLTSKSRLMQVIEELEQDIGDLDDYRCV